MKVGDTIVRFRNSNRFIKIGDIAKVTQVIPAGLFPLSIRLQGYPGTFNAHHFEVTNDTETNKVHRDE